MAALAFSAPSALSWVTPPMRSRKVFSSEPPMPCTDTSCRPPASARVRTSAAVTGWSNFSSTTVPPAKSTPKLKPHAAMPTRMARLMIVDAKMAIFRLPMKSMFVLCLMSLMASPFSDRHRLGVAAVDEVGGDDARHHDGREQRGQQSDDERRREPANRAGTGGEQDEAGDQRGDVRVEDGPERAIVALVHRLPRRLAVIQLLADALVDEHVGVHRDAQREHEAGDARQRQRGVEERQAREDEQ